MKRYDQQRNAETEKITEIEKTVANPVITDFHYITAKQRKNRKKKIG